VSRLLQHNGTIRWITALTISKPRKVYSKEARAAISARNRDIMRRKVEAGLFVPPSKDPAAAAKISAAHRERVRLGLWQQPRAPDKESEDGPLAKDAGS